MNARMKGFWIKPLAALAVACAACTAFADLFYWQISEAVYGASTGREGESVEFSYASVSADDGTTRHLLHVYDQSGETEFWRLYARQDDATSANPTYSGSFDSSLISSLYVQLWDSSDTEVAWQRYTVSDVSGSIWKGATDTAPSGGATVWTVTSVVPEPTSGLLLLLGLAGLGLRRKRA